MDVGLRVLVDPALMAAVLGRVDRREIRAAQAVGEARRRARDEPVVAVHEVEAQPLSELPAGGVHVRVHALDPGDEGVEVERHLVLGHAVHDDAGDGLGRRHVAPAARQHVDLDAGSHERLRQLADVSREPACDDRGVLPRQDEDTRAQGRAILPVPRSG